MLGKAYVFMVPFRNAADTVSIVLLLPLPPQNYTVAGRRRRFTSAALHVVARLGATPESEEGRGLLPNRVHLSS